MTSTPTRFAMLDLDGTLVDSNEPMCKWARNLCDRHALPDGSAQWILDQRDLYATWQDFVGAAAEHFGHGAAASEWTDHLLRNYPREFVLDPAAAARLEALRAAGWRLAIVTNGGTTMQTAKIDQVRLHDYVDVICISEAEGVSKPDRAIFERAAGKLGVDLGSHGWMVGDTLGADIVGGIAAGVRTIWLAGEPTPGGPVPDEAAALTASELQPDHVCDSIAAALDVILASG